MTENNTKVSIVIPVYNVENYVAECLTSVINQTFKDFEVIVVNDGSKDNSLNIVEEFARKDSRIIVINQENQGLSGARNSGMKYVKGDYVTFIDSDDWISPAYIENLYKVITENNADISCASVIRKGKHKNKYRFNFKEVKSATELSEKIKICRVPDCCYVWGKMYKKELIENAPFKLGVYFEDMFWLPSVLKNSGKLVTTPDTVYYYRVNNSSIVKTPSPKKQLDSYHAKKKIVKFFRENNLILPQKEQNITKSVKYLFNIPVLKQKENGYLNTWYLFSFLPVFRYTDFDSHYIFKIFNIGIRIRHKSQFDYKPATEYGLTTEKRPVQLIVSLTTHPPRIGYVSTAVNTLLRQTVRPDRIILWLAEKEFPSKEQELPEELLKLRDLGLEIRWCENLRPYKKIVPALEAFPDDIIVTADDDLYYEEDWLESLYNAYLKNPKNIYARRAVRMKIVNGQITPYKRDELRMMNHKKAGFDNQLQGGSGTLFPPHSLHNDVLNKEKFLSLIPTHDDIYLWIMAVLKGTKVEVVEGYDAELFPIDETTASGLCKINNKTGAGMHPSEAFRRIKETYPQVIDIIDSEKIN